MPHRWCSRGVSVALTAEVCAGPWEDVTASIKFSVAQLPAEPDDFVGRAVDLHRGGHLILKQHTHCV